MRLATKHHEKLSGKLGDPQHHKQIEPSMMAPPQQPTKRESGWFKSVVAILTNN